MQAKDREKRTLMRPVLLRHAVMIWLILSSPL
jgi:hypothetical protein